MPIKDLFIKGISKPLSQQSLSTIGEKIESADYIEKAVEDKFRFIPQVDFRDPASFARWGSAEKYYTDSFEYILSSYPYDGSLKEKLEWQLSSSYLDLYIFEHSYPRTNGYINLGKSYGSVNAALQNGYGSYGNNNYIQLKGGPNTASVGMIGKTLFTTFADSNKYNTTYNRISNLDINGTTGLTLEFWLKKNTFQTSSVESTKQVIFDIWNSSSFGTSNYGRFKVEIQSGSNQFNVELSSGTTAGLSSPGSSLSIGQNLSIDSNEWKHYSLSLINSGSAISAKLYANGVLNHSVLTGSSIGHITGSQFGQIGSLVTSQSGTNGAQGWGKLSGSLDEFRFWKTRRTAEQIGKYWFTQVGAGTNTDTANTDLGVYYKFNEGVLTSGTVLESQDKRVLDYSGRVSNGFWIGYSSGSRSTGSAIMEAQAASTEFADPILYSNHKLYINNKLALELVGKFHDETNSSDLYGSFPHFITENDRDGIFYNLTQIVGSYFDDVYLQIEALPRLRNADYTTGSFKPFPFINRFLESAGFITSEIFQDADALETFANRDNYREFQLKFSDVKNKIYQNIYNNLSYILKSKGTYKSFRNLIRAYGIDEELVRINIYGDNVDYKLEDGFRSSYSRKKYINFNDVDRFDSTVYQVTSSGDSNTRSFINASQNLAYLGNTFQADVIFPKKFDISSELYFNTPFIIGSIFGCHEASGSETADKTWVGSDKSNFQVQVVRPKLNSKDAYFRLTGTNGSVLPTLTSSLYQNVYDNERWNFAVRIKPSGYPFAGSVTGSASNLFNVEFIGVNNTLDIIENKFIASGTISAADAIEFMRLPKRFFVGAHRTNFTGSVREYSDVKISSLRAWMNYLDDETIIAHARDSNNIGVLYPSRKAYLTQLSSSFGTNDLDVINQQTLALNWDFENVTGSSDSSDSLPTTSDATFEVKDRSSGSVALTNRYRWLGNIVNYQHPGKGDFFLPFDTGSVNRELIVNAAQKQPEVLTTDSFVDIRTQDDLNFDRRSRPISYFFAVEKSMYSIISDEILKVFATIKDFNNLIGDPINRYRQDYKLMSKLRERVFEQFSNEPDIEKFIDYFKWIDDSLSIMIQQLIPASANFASDLRTVVESHILERNKIWNKLPTLEFKENVPTAGIRGIHELSYPWNKGHHPVSNLISQNGYYWKERAERNVSPNSSGDSNVDSNRGSILSATLSVLNRNFSVPYSATIIQQTSLTGAGISVADITNLKNSKASASYNDKLFIINPVENYGLLGRSDIKQGTFEKDHEVVMTNGYTTNPRRFIKSEGYPQTFNNNISISGVADFTLPEASLYKSQHIIVNRFNAPGGPEVSGRGALDLVGEELSVYNNLNYRNLTVRTALNNLEVTHSSPFGLRPDNSGVPNYHKINRNPRKLIVEVGTLTATSSNYDNAFIQHPIPRSDLQYYWVSASQDLTKNQPFGHVDKDHRVPSGTTSIIAPQIQYLSASNVVSYYLTSSNARLFSGDKDHGFAFTGSRVDLVPVDFVGLNSNINEPISASLNTLGFPALILKFADNPGTTASIAQIYNYINPTFINQGADAAASGLAAFDIDNYFNALMHHRNGPYQGASWKSLKHAEHPIVRNHRKQNIISIIDRPRTVTFTGSFGLIVYKNTRPDSFKNYIDPVVSVKFKPLIHILKITGSTSLTEIKHSYGNNLDTFGNPNLVNHINSFVCEPQAYDRISEMYLNTDIPEGANAIEGFVNLIYSETIFPKESNTTLTKSRGRTLYEEEDGYGYRGYDRNPVERRSFWRNKASSRLRETGSTLPKNSMNFTSSIDRSMHPFGTSFSAPSASSGPIPFGTSSDTYGWLDANGNLIRGSGELNSIGAKEVISFSYRIGPNLGAVYPFEGLTMYPTASQSYVNYWASQLSSDDDEAGYPPGWYVDVYSGKKPAYDSYAEFSEDIRRIGQDYSILPEFKISDHLNYYVEEQGGNFKARLDNVFNIDGSEISSSAISEQSGFSEDFFKTYSHSDFMKYFDVVYNDHNIDNIKMNRLKLSIKGIKKFLPYNGFYPSSRCLQLGTLLSQSIGPYIGGLHWKNGAPTSSAPPHSGAVALQSLLQPFFAPGIMYNTIKSGIAVDWPGYTGSATFLTGAQISFNTVPNYRIPFEAMVDFSGYIPISSSTQNNGIYYIPDPATISPSQGLTSSHKFDAFFDWNGQKSPLFELATNNFLAEVAKFYLNGQGFKTFQSKPASTFSGKFVAGTTYYMDVEIFKTDDMVMFEDFWTIKGPNRWNNAGQCTTEVTGTKSLTGRWFGPGLRATAPSEQLTNIRQDPQQAPWTPPYLYGRSTARISYLADGNESGTDVLNQILSNATITYFNKEREDFFNRIESDSTPLNNLDSPAFTGAMHISASVNLLGKTSQKRVSYSANDFSPQTAQDPENNAFDIWVISPKFECPTLNFADQPQIGCTGVAGTVPLGRMPRGMWSGYGKNPSGSQGIFLELKESFAPFQRNSNTGSLIDICGFQPGLKRIGEVALTKPISEAIIAIPFVDEIPDSRFADTVRVLNKNFFKISKKLFDFQKKQIEAGKPAIPNNIDFGDIGSDKIETSISNMINNLKEFVLPPELDFLTFKEINPFVMYVFKFNHIFDQQDLIDMWQGVLPKIGETPQKEEQNIEHTFDKWEFFEGKPLPPNVRWLVFKVKQKAEKSYFNVTADSLDDDRFKFEFKTGVKTPEYSYNWPYDYFSLVELAKIDSEVELAATESEQKTIKPFVRTGIFKKV